MCDIQQKAEDGDDAEWGVTKAVQISKPSFFFNPVVFLFCLLTSFRQVPFSRMLAFQTPQPDYMCPSQGV